MTVSPARLAIKPGDLADTQLLTVINRGKDAVRLTVQKRDFVSAPDGSLQYEKSAPYGAARWLTMKPTQFRLAPGATQLVTADFRVPSKPDLGDHQVAIVVLAPAGDEKGNIKINRGVAMPIFLTVPGPVDDTVILDGLTGPSWSMYGDVDLTASLRNTGTVHRDFRGETRLTLTSAGATTRFNDFTIPRGSARNTTTSWDPPLVCICHPTVALTNTEGATQSATVRVIIFPWWLAAGLLLIGLSIGFLAWYRRRQSRRSFVAPLTGAAAVSGGGA